MDRPDRVAHLYGYTVCLVAVVTFLVSAHSLVRAGFALADPLRSEDREFGFEPSVSSFEAFRATYMFGGAGGAVVVGRAAGRSAADSSARADTLSTADLRARYEALRADRVGRTRYQAAREAVTSGLLLVLALILFALHWRWLRERESRVSTVSRPA